MSTNVSVLTALIEARRLIDKGWAQQTFARDGNGCMCDWGSEHAKSFCSIGAIYKATDWRNTYNSSLCVEVIKAVADQMTYHIHQDDIAYRVTGYNDARKKEEVLDAFDRAIAAQMKVGSLNTTWDGQWRAEPLESDFAI